MWSVTATARPAEIRQRIASLVSKTATSLFSRNPNVWTDVTMVSQVLISSAPHVSLLAELAWLQWTHVNLVSLDSYWARNVLINVPPDIQQIARDASDVIPDAKNVLHLRLLDACSAKVLSSFWTILVSASVLMVIKPIPKALFASKLSLLIMATVQVVTAMEMEVLEATASSSLLTISMWMITTKPSHISPHRSLRLSLVE